MIKKQMSFLPSTGSFFAASVHGHQSATGSG